MLYDVRCSCGKLLGKINGRYEIKCPRCKNILVGMTLAKDKQYDKTKGV